MPDDELAEDVPNGNNLDEIEGNIDTGEPTSELHAALYRQGVGVQKVMSAQLYKLFPDKEITIKKITASTDIYMSYLQSAPTLQWLVSAIVNQVVSQLMVVRRLRGEQSTNKLRKKLS